MAEFELRKEAWEHTRKLSWNITRKTEFANKFGEGGQDLVNRLVEMLKGIQYNLGVAEYELQIPGAVLENDFQKSVKNVVDRVKSVIDLLEKTTDTVKIEERENVRTILEDLALLFNWVNERRPLVTEINSSYGSEHKEYLVRMLTESNNADRLLVIPNTIDSDGIDKTTLASHVYHDSRVHHHFDVRHWVYMSDPLQRRGKLLDEVFIRQNSDRQILNKYHLLVDNRRYLLILDDVTQPVPGNFLHELLSYVGKGSKILLTTSNKDTLKTVAPLQLAIDPFELEKFQKLPPILQQCLNYCSLFPMKYKYVMEDLIHLWVAQDLFVEERRPGEVTGKIHFSSIEGVRYLLEDGKNDGNGARVCYKMPDEVNEFIKNVAENEFRLVVSPEENIEYNSFLHLSFLVNSSWRAPSLLHSAKQLLSLLMLSKNPFDLAPMSNIGEILSSLKRLRALDLAAVNCQDLPDSLGELQDLRYLRLGCSSESLSECIIKLQNLQTLDLRPSKVIELPKDFCKLINLRHFYTGERLQDMPPNFGELTSLWTLDEFIVGPNNRLDALANMTNLCGKLKIRYEKHYKNDVAVLKGKELTGLSLMWPSSFKEPDDGSDFLQLPSSLDSLEVNHCKRVLFLPLVIGEFSSLQSLVSVVIKGCSRCDRLPDFSILPRLKSLYLWDLHALEYIENADGNRRVSSATLYYPSLKRLTLAILPRLKAWSNVNNQLSFPCLAVIMISGCPKMTSIPGAPGLESLEVENIDENLLKNLLGPPELPSTLTTSKLKVLQITSVHQMGSLKINPSTIESLKIKRCPELNTVDLESLTRLREFEIHECGMSMTITSCVLKHLSVDWKQGTISARVKGREEGLS